MTTPPQDYQPSWRKPAGVGLILLIIAGWAMLVVSVMDWIGPLPTLLGLAIYAVVGSSGSCRSAPS